MSYPVRTALIIPSDAEPWAADAAPYKKRTVEFVRNWIMAETELAGLGKWGFDYEFTEHHSAKTRREFATNPAGIHDPDDCGDMVFEGPVWDVVINELKWPKWEGDQGRGDSEFRQWLDVIHGGGVAMGRATPYDHYDRALYTHMQAGNYGIAIYGCWDHRYLVTGSNTICTGVYKNGRFPEAKTLGMSPSSGHEAFHMFNSAHCHDPVIWPGHTPHLTRTQIQEITTYNPDFIVKLGTSVVVPPMPTPEDPPDDQPPPVMNPLTVTPESAIIHRYFGKRSVTVTANKPITQVKSLNTSVAVVTQTSATTVKITHAAGVRPTGSWMSGGLFVQVAIVCGVERVFFPVTVRW